MSDYKKSHTEIDEVVAELIDVMLSERYAIHMINVTDKVHNFHLNFNMDVENIMNFLLFRACICAVEICKDTQSDARFAWDTVNLYIRQMFEHAYSKVSQIIDEGNFEITEMRDVIEVVLQPLFFPKEVGK